MTARHFDAGDFIGALARKSASLRKPALSICWRRDAFRWSMTVQKTAAGLPRRRLFVPCRPSMSARPRSMNLSFARAMAGHDLNVAHRFETGSADAHPCPEREPSIVGMAHSVRLASMGAS
jgi:hypothetical protein